MKTINMGLNQEPPKTEAELKEIFDRIDKNCGGDSKAKEWQLAGQKKANDLKEEIIRVVEAEGAAELNWSCTGETRFNIHANQWAKALPQYRFEIARYRCVVYKN